MRDVVSIRVARVFSHFVHELPFPGALPSSLPLKSDDTSRLAFLEICIKVNQIQARASARVGKISFSVSRSQAGNSVFNAQHAFLTFMK